ncbi:unnamed protein product [Cylindrotheca closterium]|uniref:Cyclin-dependent kinase 2 homolog n=1 Tax=Cylindrotheca closterium TaxID=2856 RepID=A0AAD2FNQ8_9STRA|nr:unnamed protein product [Cylindrotheca closterium]
MNNTIRKPARKKYRKSIVSAGRCESASSRFEKIGRIGEGTYGIVYKALDRKSNNSLVALKRCIPHHESSDGFPLTTLREIHALNLAASHPNVVDLLTVAVSDSGVFLAMPLVGNDLAAILDDPTAQPFSEAEVKTLVRQLLSALDFCHGHSLIHRDVKPSNLLISYKTGLMLADFGLSRHIYKGQCCTVNVVSLWYRAPELLMQRNCSAYSFGIDMWAVGCVFAELLEGSPLIPGTDDNDQIEKMIRCMGRPPLNFLSDHIPKKKGIVSTGNLWDRFVDLSNEGLLLMARLLEYDYTVRLTASQAMQCEYFQVHPLPSTKISTLLK